MSSIKHRKKRRILICAAVAVLLMAAVAALWTGIWHANFSRTDNSYFDSDFMKNREVLVLIAHQDDEINLAYGVIDAFVQAGSHVTVAYTTNGDYGGDAQTRVAEAIQAEALMGVDWNDIVLLGYGDHTVPPYFLCAENEVRQSEIGRAETYGAVGIPDYHTLRTSQAAAYTRANFEGDIRALILSLRPDRIFVTDTDYNIDHVSVSQSFDRVMGEILRQDNTYRPAVFKGFCYAFAWHANNDFYHFLTLQSAVIPWSETSYHPAYAWEERVRFPLPGEYLSYTLRSSRLYRLLEAYQSQKGLEHLNSLLNSDRVFWQRSTDVLWADVTASSGNAVLLQDFLIGDTMEASLANCWMPDPDDGEPTIRFEWTEPQNIAELVFYDAPAPAGDILRIRISDDSGFDMEYALPNGSGAPCRLALEEHPVQSLTIRILESRGGPIGLSEIEILPRQDQPTQWIQWTDSDNTFLYEYSHPAQQALALNLYGYPAAPEEATAYLTKEGSEERVAEIPNTNQGFLIPPLDRGRYRVHAAAGGCSADIVLRIGDSMIWERVLRLVERKYDGLVNHR